jgi:hypothetical protein
MGDWINCLRLMAVFCRNTAIPTPTAARPWGSYARLALFVELLNLLQRLLFRTISNLHPVFLHSRANNKDKEQEQEQRGLRKEERVRERASHVE